MPYRVIQWATGNLGRAAIEGIVSHPELELAGCWVHSADKAGRDAGTLAGIDPLGVVATNDVAAILATDADCVLYSPLLAKPREVIAILESGKNVVTPLGWFFPDRSSKTTQEIEAACRRAHVTLHGTGIHPGGITERFPLMISALSRDIRHVRAEEFSDIRSYAAPNVVRDVMLFGHAPEAAAKSPMLAILGGGFAQSIDMLAHALGFALDAEKRTHHAMAVATRAIETPVGTLAAGTVAAQRFTWQGTVRGEPVITVAVNWLMGEEHLDPAWSFGAERERFEVEISGDPPAKLVFHGLHPTDFRAAQKRNPGMVATAIHCVSAIPFVCRAAPGIATYLDLPLVHGRAHASLG
ncbi:MAG: dihydrodipicolinate reductase [Myxococcota bacterium]|jgi:hypothetical protein|nr:dihydrodipicolinate reductase [Myxococcota bacterium]